jgi:surface antigen
MSMNPIFRALGVVALLAVAGCSTNDSSNYSQEPMLGTTPPPNTDFSGATDTSGAMTPPPSQVATTGVQNLDISAFTDPTGFRLMSDTDKSQASSAQYFALQFGRVGAARTWSGDQNVTGQINVGPFVKVNNNDCRDFTNIVNVGAHSYTKRGTACRGADGTWTVGTAAAAASAAPAAPAAGMAAPGMAPPVAAASGGAG